MAASIHAKGIVLVSKQCSQEAAVAHVPTCCSSFYAH